MATPFLAATGSVAALIALGAGLAFACSRGRWLAIVTQRGIGGVLFPLVARFHPLIGTRRTLTFTRLITSSGGAFTGGLLPARRTWILMLLLMGLAVAIRIARPGFGARVRGAWAFVLLGVRTLVRRIFCQIAVGFGLGWSLRRFIRGCRLLGGRFFLLRARIVLTV